MFSLLLGLFLEDFPLKPLEVIPQGDRHGYGGGTDLPARFIPNSGLFPKDVAFASHNGYVRVFKDGGIAIGGVQIRFRNAEKPEISPLHREGIFSLFSGKRNIPSLPVYRSVKLENLYKGVDFVFNGVRDGELEFYLYVEKGADPERVEIEVKGGKVEIYPDRILISRDGKTVLRIGNLKAFQGSKSVKVAFRKVDRGTFAFTLDGYDPSHDLVIDPTVFLASFIKDRATYVLPVGDGTVYVVGYTEDYLNFAGGYDYLYGAVQSGNKSVFVSRLSDDFSTHLATAIISGSGNDYGWHVAIADDSTIYVGASTSSTDYAPTRTVFGTTSAYFYDAAVSRLSSDLSRHMATAIVAGSDVDVLRAIDVGDDGTVYLVGYTYNSSDLAPSRVIHGDLGLADGYITRLSHDLSTHLATAILTGTSNDAAYNVKVLSDGVYVIGTTSSNDFAPSRVVFGTAGGWDAFVTKLSFDLSTHLKTVIIGGTGADVGYNIFPTDAGDLLIFGRATNSTTFAPSRTIWGTPGERDPFVSRFSSDLSSHLATVIIASPDTDIVLYHTYDVRGDTAFMAVSTVDPSNLAGSSCNVCNVGSGGGPMDVVLIAMRTDLTACVGKSVITGGGDDGAYALNVEGSDVYVAGVSVISDTNDLPTYPQPHYTYGPLNSDDAFVVKVRPGCMVSVDERSTDGEGSRVLVLGRNLVFYLTHPAYVGYDVYSPDGRLIARKSLGYLLGGKHEFRMADLPRGAYILRVRTGERTTRMKVLITD